MVLDFTPLIFLFEGVKNPREARFFSTRTKSIEDCRSVACAGNPTDRDWRFRGRNFLCTGGVGMTPRPFSGRSTTQTSEYLKGTEGPLVGSKTQRVKLCWGEGEAT